VRLASSVDDDASAGERAPESFAQDALDIIGYPEGFRDPDFDGSVAGFGDVVIPARVDALCAEANRRLAELGHPEIRVVWDGPR
jgi:hypothetical protein